MALTEIRHEVGLQEMGRIDRVVQSLTKLSRADIRGIDENFRHRKPAVLGMEVADREPRKLDRLRCIEAFVDMNTAAIERRRQRHRLEHRTHLIDAERHTIETAFLRHGHRIVRIEVRQRRHRHHFARMHIHDDA